MKHLFRKIFKNFKYMDKQLLIVSLIMIAYGLLNIVTASSREAVDKEVPLYYFFFKQSIMLIIGLIIGLIIIKTDTGSKKFSTISMLGFIAIGICLVYVSLYGNSNRGAKNWISIAGITFQPSELAKPIIIVCLSLLFEKYYNYFKTKGINHYNKIALILFIGLTYAAIIFFQKDLGTMLIICIIFIVLFLASPILRIEKVKTSMTVLIAGTIGILILMVGTNGKILSEAQLERFNFFNPCKNYETSGYQICNSFIAINDGGLTGLGIGKSKQKYSYIPEPHTDSVFAIIAEENGLIFCAFIFIGYMVILWRILEISSRATTIRGRYISLGVATYFFAHIFINLGGLFGIIPLTGVPLPFLSYGGSFLISSICSLCLVQRVSIETSLSNIDTKVM